MRDDPITLLERELVDAARRQAVVLESPSHEPRGPWPTLRPARRRRSLGSFTAVLLSGLAVVIALGALVVLHGHNPPARPAPAAHHVVPGRRQLIDIIGVLRRPQTEADLNPRILPSAGFPLGAIDGEPDLPLVRFATTTPWGEKLYLVPSRPPTAAELAAAARRFPQIIREQNHIHDETLGVLSVGGGGGGSDAAAIEDGSAMQIDGAGRSFAGGSTQTRFILVVPAGVTRVEFYFPPQAIPAGGPVYRSSLAVAALVHGNIAAVQVDRQFGGAEPALIWYGAGGQVIKRIAGTPQFRAPQPGPETALSRAAERDPATPNRVLAAPGVGGPTTAFRVQFRLLLNDADYQFRGVGPSGSGCQSTFGEVTGGGIDDVRGRIFSDTFAPAPGRHWCPGMYTVTVAAYDRGRAGTLHGAPRPFGTATFKVTG